MRKRIILVMIIATAMIAGCAEKKIKTTEPVISITNPKPCHTGRIIVYEQGEMMFNYKGEINIINNGRNGEEIAIIVGESNQ